MLDEDFPDFYQGDCDVKTITHGRLQPFLNDHDIVMVMYYNPKSGTCKATRPMFQAAAQIVDRPNVAFAAVNCGKDSDLCIKENALFDLPNFKAYAFGRKAAQIVDRPNVAFAAVNCGKDSDLCIKENTMYYLPRFKAYGYGRSVDELQYTSSLTAQDIATYVEELPVPRFTSTPNPQRRFY